MNIVTIFSHNVSIGAHLLLLRRLGSPGLTPGLFLLKLWCFAGKQPALLPNPLGRGTALCGSSTAETRVPRNQFLSGFPAPGSNSPFLGPRTAV
ncbi:hypothetical protein SBA4_30018 [Candidatus Sulfopaludibacter sp. SbA4]|nr:hypothetical protein SBA4_30018 [Candidatus Sulfopaludibacter sp. SbA4]